MQNSKISWLNGGNTFNPWIGCSPVSPACEHCYAKRENTRRKWCSDFNKAFHFMSEAYWRGPVSWNRKSDPKRPTLVFCGSLCDVFELDPALYQTRVRLFNLIRDTPNLLWLLLTKRPENIVELSPVQDFPSNAWLGVTAENQEMANERCRTLCRLPFPVSGRFMSCEPLLGKVILDFWSPKPDQWGSKIDWVIAGGERGTESRKTESSWFDILLESCEYFGTPFFFKQFGDAFAKRLKEGAGFVRHEFSKQFGIV